MTKSLTVYLPDGTAVGYKVGEKAFNADFIETVTDICFMDYGDKECGEKTVADVHFENAILTIVNMPCMYFRTLKPTEEEKL